MEEHSIEIRIVGDSGPFSRLGKSIGYHLIADEAEFLVDCGGPVFQMLGEQGLERIDGIVATHTHEDHKRWFTDICLFNKFPGTTDEPINLLASRRILEDYRHCSATALEQTLGPDSRRIVNYSFEDFARPMLIAPEPKYRIVKPEHPKNKDDWQVVDQRGNILGPEQARVIIPEKDVARPRLLFKDPELKEWVEPQAFYSFDDPCFYDQETYTPYEHENGLKIYPYKAPAWHGLFVTAMMFEFNGNRIFFSSDTRYDPELWKELTEKLEPAESPDAGAASENTVLKNRDINDYIERIWSQRRYKRAMEFYDKDNNLPVIHDVSGPWARVHTDYREIEDQTGELLLTHSPDVFTTLHPMAHVGKTFVIKENEFYEKNTGGDLFRPTADCYYKNFQNFFVGYENNEGGHFLVKTPRDTFDIKEQPADEDRVLKQIQLYEDIDGRYFPYFKEKNAEYYKRPDGRVERLFHHKDGSKGTIVKDLRPNLQ